ncbi:MAG: MFS transporter [Verrucomicrobiota bacterium]
MNLQSNDAPSLGGVETLQYSKKGLITLFSWLLWGDFAFVFFETVFGKFLPLFLRELHVSNFMIGILSGSTVGLVNVFCLPPISRWSDLFRSRWGRRIPFLFWSTPLTALTVILVGYAPETGSWVYQHAVAPYFPKVTQEHVIVTQLVIWVFAFNFFNMILVNAFNWLVCDVVPQFIMARFLSWFRVVGTLSSCVFMWCVFPYILTYRKEVCIGVGIFYTIAFWLMCSKVKEGSYPPPPPKNEQPGFFKSFGIYFQECLREPIHRYFFLAYTLVVAAISSSGPFILLFSKETLGLEMSDLGKVFAYAAILSALLYFVVGWICDKTSPILVAIGGVVCFALISIGAYFFVHGKIGWIVYSLVSTFPGIAWGIGYVTTGMRIFPREKYGQFSAGLNVFGCGFLIVFNFLSGKLMDWSGSDYRVIFLWCFSLFSLSALCLWKVHQVKHINLIDLKKSLP